MAKPTHELFLSVRGRIPRLTWWAATFGATVVFALLFILLENITGYGSTLILYPPFFWAIFVLAAKRYHDVGKSAWWLLLVVIPLAGVLWVFLELAFRRGIAGENRYGADPSALGELDYLTVK